MIEARIKHSKIFYGWVIVACSSVAIFMATSSRYSFPIFMKPLTEEFGWSRSQLGGAMSLNMILYSLLSPFVGVLIDRVGARVILPLGAGVIGLGLWLLGSTQNLFGLYLSFGIITSVGLALTYFVPNLSLARKWFQSRAGLATGMVALGSGLGLAVIAPTANYLVQTFGWRVGVRVIASATWILVIPLSILFIRNDPESVGLNPDGIPTPSTPALNKSNPPPVEELLHFLLSRVFIHLFSLYFIYSLVICGVLTHFFLWGTKDLKLSGGLVAFALSLQTLCATGSRLLGGWLSDRWGRRPFIGFSLLGLGLAFLVAFFIRNKFELYLFAIIFGAAYGLPLAVYPAYLGDLFGRRLTGSLYGVLIMAGGLAGGLGAWSFGLAVDKWGSYHPAYIISILLLLPALISVLVIRPKRLAGWKAESRTAGRQKMNERGNL